MGPLSLALVATLSSAEPARGQSMPASAAYGLGAAAGASAQEASDSNRITFLVRGLRNDRGRVLGGLFDHPARWVRSGSEAATCRASISRGVARCVMRVPAPGRYAFAFAHDEDGDGQFDRDLLGIPSEGYGFSNDVRPTLSPPSWQSAAFEVGPQRPRELVVNVRYGI